MTQFEKLAAPQAMRGGPLDAWGETCGFRRGRVRRWWTLWLWQHRESDSEFQARIKAWLNPRRS